MTIMGKNLYHKSGAVNCNTELPGRNKRFKNLFKDIQCLFANKSEKQYSDIIINLFKINHINVYSI